MGNVIDNCLWLNKSKQNNLFYFSYDFEPSVYISVSFLFQYLLISFFS